MERNGRKYFSISEIKVALQCGAQHWFRYTLQLRKPSPVAVARGAAYDRALQALYEARLAGREPDVEEAERAAEAYWTEAEVDWQDEDPEAAREQVRQAIRLYYAEVWPYIRPAAFQDRFEIEFHNTDWTFIGFIDLVTEDGQVRENKLYTRTPNQDDADRDLQLTAYALGYQQKYGRLPERLGLDCVVLTKTPKVVRIDTVRTQADIDRFLAVLGQAVLLIESGIVVPRPGGWYCSPTACQYWRECHQTFGGVTV